MQNVSDYSDPNNSWHREFPRLAKLLDNTPSAAPGTFFQGILNEASKSPLAREHSQVLESDLAALDEEAWSAFKLKLLRCDVGSHGHRGYTGILSVLNEAKGYQYLKVALGEWGIEYDEITLIPEKNRQKTPDWAAALRGVPIAILEVKTVYESDDQSKYVYDNTRRILEHAEATIRRGDSHIPDALWHKLKLTVDYARQQLDGYAPERNVPRIALLIVHFNRDLTDDPANYSSVASFLNGLGGGMFHVACEFRGTNAPPQNVAEETAIGVEIGRL